MAEKSEIHQQEDNRYFWVKFRALWSLWLCVLTPFLTVALIETDYASLYMVNKAINKLIENYLVRWKSNCELESRKKWHKRTQTPNGPVGKLNNILACSSKHQHTDTKTRSHTHFGHCKYEYVERTQTHRSSNNGNDSIHFVFESMGSALFCWARLLNTAELYFRSTRRKLFSIFFTFLSVPFRFFRKKTDQFELYFPVRCSFLFLEIGYEIIMREQREKKKHWENQICDVPCVYVFSRNVIEMRHISSQNGLRSNRKLVFVTVQMHLISTRIDYDAVHFICICIYSLCMRIEIGCILLRHSTNANIDWNSIILYLMPFCLIAIVAKTHFRNRKYLFGFGFGFSEIQSTPFLCRYATGLARACVSFSFLSSLMSVHVELRNQLLRATVCVSRPHVQLYFRWWEQFGLFVWT